MPEIQRVTSHALAKQLLNGPDVPVRITIDCFAGGTRYNTAESVPGELEVKVNFVVDEVVVTGVDPDLFEYLDGEVADHIHAERKTP